MQKLNYYQSIVVEDYREKKDHIDICEKIDNMYNGVWKLPPALANKPWMREFKTTAPHDSMYAAARVFSTRIPFIEVQPLSSLSKEVAENQEAFLQWNLKKLQRRAPKDPLYEIMLSGVKYSEIAFQTVYLPYKFKGQSGPRIDAIKRMGDFVWLVHDPKTIFPRISQFGLESIKQIVLKTASDIEDEFGDKNPGVIKMKAKLTKELDKDTALPALMAKRKVTYYEYTDYKVKVCWISLSQNEILDTTGGGLDAIELYKEEHKLPFLNWVYKRDDHPLMKPVIDADLYNNANILESLQYWLVVATVAQTRTWSKTLNKEGIEISHDEPASQARLGLGEDVGVLQSSQLDPNLKLLIDGVRGDIRKSTTAEALSSIEKIALGAPFSTVNAIIQASIASLSPIKKIAEVAIEEGLTNMLHWIKHSGIPSTAYRMTGTTAEDVTKMQGAHITINPEEIDPNEISITVDLQADTPTDKQSKIDMAVKMVQFLSMSPKRAMEENGIEYEDSDLEDFLSWRYLDTEQQADMKRIMGKVDLEMQAQVMQMQMAAQQAQQQQQPQPQPEQPVSQDQMIDAYNKQNAMSGENRFQTTRGLGRTDENPPINTEPGIGREQVNGTTASGQEIA